MIPNRHARGIKRPEPVQRQIPSLPKICHDYKELRGHVPIFQCRQRDFKIRGIGIIKCDANISSILCDVQNGLEQVLADPKTLLRCGYDAYRFPKSVKSQDNQLPHEKWDIKKPTPEKESKQKTLRRFLQLLLKSKSPN